MKKNIVTLSALILAGIAISTACNFSTAPVQETEESSTTTLTPVTFDDDFIRGFDASAVDYYDINWYNTDGTQADFFEILAAHGVNTVRLRIWNDPSQEVEGSVPEGDNTLERTLRMAKSIKDAGLDFMLDFHYSDTWADPGKQIVPAEWADLTSVSDVEEALADYTKEVLTELKNINCLPDYVQVGNEINNGILRHDGYSSEKGTASSSPTFPLGTAKEDGSTYNYLKYLAAGCDAVRDVSSDIKIVLHVASSSSGSDTSTIAAIENYGEIDYDIIGLSYYPWESSHGTISDMQTKLSNWKSSYNKDVIIAECSGIWNYSTSDTSALETETAHMIDPDTGSVYSDLTMDSSSTYITGSIANQKAIVRHIMDAAYDAGACGVFTWGGETRASWKWAMFTYNGVAMDSIDAFNYTPVSSSSSSSQTSTQEIYSGSFTADGSLQQFLTADYFENYTISKITLTASDIDWGSSTDWRWLKAYSDNEWDSTALTLIDYDYDSDSTDESSGTDSLSTTSTISAIQTNGLYLAGLSGMSCTISVTAEVTSE